MILGQSRTPFSRPAAAAAGWQPKLPHTGFYSHFHPLTLVTRSMAAASGMYRPSLPAGMGPTPLPPIPPPPAPAPVVTAAAPTAPTVPKAGGTAGFGSAFGSTGGVRAHANVDPYRVMRMGMIPGVFPNASNLRAGINNVGARVRGSMPFQTAPLPPPPPPPPPPAAVAPAPAATHGFGYFGAHLYPDQPRRRHRRHWLSRMWRPETIHEVAANQHATCEDVYDSVSGMTKTICNGRVTQYKDAQGNVLRPGDYA
jgi:hypothetical protein